MILVVDDCKVAFIPLKEASGQEYLSDVILVICNSVKIVLVFYTMLHLLKGLLIFFREALL